jgi:murein L,D-transpeptidase YafK
VHIFPFRMTDARMRRALSDRRAGEWLTLKVGYDRFEAEARPPEVFVCNRGYAFKARHPTCTGVNGGLATASVN